MARRKKRGASRRRLLGRGAAAVLVAAALGVAVWWLLTAPLFAVTRLESGPYRYTEEAALQRALAGCLHHNIFRLSTDEVAAQLQALPWVRDLRVRRRLPGTVVVDFREWRPVLELPAAKTGGRPRLLLENGRVLPVPAHLEAPGLPVLVDARLASDGMLQEPAVSDVLALVDALAATGLEAVAPVDFVLCRREGFAIVLQDGRGSLRVGREDYRARLDRYIMAQAQVPAGSDVDLRFSDRITFVPPVADAR